MRFKIIPLVIILIYSCASLTEIQPIEKSSCEFDTEICSIPFPKGNWQFIHSIQASMPNNKNAFIMGITNISSETRNIQVVMMTVEGLVLFDAEYNGKIKINKGITPFDATEFAKGIMEDIKLILFKPEGMMKSTGCFKNGSRVCRYKDEKGFVIDISFGKDSADKWEIRKYNKHNRLKRLVKTASIFKKQRSKIPRKIELTGYGRQSYSLKLDLIEAKSLDK